MGAPTDRNGVSLLSDPEDTLLTGEAVELDVRPAGLPSRAVAALIDWLLAVILFLLLWLALLSVQLPLGIDDAMAQALLVLIVALSFVAVPLAVEQLSEGRSLGRLAMGIRIVRDDGGRVLPLQSLTRAGLGLLEVGISLGALAAIVAMLSPRGKRLGDLLAGTYAQLERLPTLPEHRLGMPPGLGEWAATADAARLPPGLARRIARFHEQAAQLHPGPRLQQAERLLAEAAPFVHPLPEPQQAHPEAVLIGIAVLRRERQARRLALAREQEHRLQPVLESLPFGFPDR